MKQVNINGKHVHIAKKDENKYFSIDETAIAKYGKKLQYNKYFIYNKRKCHFYGDPWSWQTIVSMNISGIIKLPITLYVVDGTLIISTKKELKDFIKAGNDAIQTILNRRHKL